MPVASKMVPPGTKAPEFSLPDTISGRSISLNQIKSEVAIVVMFLCNHCPYVVHIKDVLAMLAADYQKRGINFVGISSNNVENNPEDSPQRMKNFAAQAGFTFPYCYDESQDVARAYDVSCTPDFYVFDKNLELVYHGRFDDSLFGTPIPVTGNDLRCVLDALVEGKKIMDVQYPSLGCSIKWK